VRGMAAVTAVTSVGSRWLSWDHDGGSDSTPRLAVDQTENVGSLPFEQLAVAVSKLHR